MVTALVLSAEDGIYFKDGLVKISHFCFYYLPTINSWSRLESYNTRFSYNHSNQSFVSLVHVSEFLRFFLFYVKRKLGKKQKRNLNQESKRHPFRVNTVWSVGSSIFPPEVNHDYFGLVDSVYIRFGLYSVWFVFWFDLIRLFFV